MANQSYTWAMIRSGRVPRGPGYMQANQNPNKLYDLIWNGQTLISGQPYPVCNGHKTKLIQAGTHNRLLFKIEPHL